MSLSNQLPLIRLFIRSFIFGKCFTLVRVMCVSGKEENMPREHIVRDWSGWPLFFCVCFFCEYTVWGIGLRQICTLFIYDSADGKNPQLYFLFQSYRKSVEKSVDILYGWKSLACDEFCCSHHSLESLAIVGRVTDIPYSDAPSQDTLYGTAVEVSPG